MHARRGKVLTSRRPSALNVGVLCVLSVYFLVPSAWLFVSLTKDTAELFRTGGFGFGSGIYVWRNLVRLFRYHHHVYLYWLANTVLYAGVGSIGSTLISAMAGYAYAKYDFRGRKSVFTVILGGVLIPGSVVVIPLYLFMSNLGLIDTRWAMLLPGLVDPLGVYLGMIYIRSAVPNALIDSARVDGAGEVTIFRTIVLRLSRPGLVVIYVLHVVAVWNNFFLPLMVLSSPRLLPVTVGLITLIATAVGVSPPYGVLIAGAVVSFVPVVLAFSLLQRQFQHGLASGAVTG